MESWIYKQGEQKGFGKGEQEGFGKGIKQGKREGKKEGKQEAVVLVYETRFGPMPAELRSRVETTEDAARVERWCQLVASASKEEVDAELAIG
jgi:flagellar biosynthesis/type III secretory pathway protein FliH